MKKNILSNHKNRLTLFIIVIFFFTLFLIVKYISTYNYYHTHTEGLTEQIVEKKQIILLGDSVLKNDRYVAANKTIEAFIKENIALNILNKTLNKTLNVVNYAKDDYYISDIDLNLLKEYNNDHTYIFLSIGGNDLIRMRNTEKVMDSYKKIIERLKTTVPLAKVFLLNLYYPPIAQESTPIKKMIEEWNLLLAKQANANISILDTSTLLTVPTDFVSKIEPSETGGKKLAEAILAKTKL
jgi:lysophospholipase L1-like esterase